MLYNDKNHQSQQNISLCKIDIFLWKKLPFIYLFRFTLTLKLLMYWRSFLGSHTQYLRLYALVYVSALLIKDATWLFRKDNNASETLHSCPGTFLLFFCTYRSVPMRVLGLVVPVPFPFRVLEINWASPHYDTSFVNREETVNYSAPVVARQIDKHSKTSLWKQ